MAIDKALAEELKAKHGPDLHNLGAEEHEIVVRRPTRADWHRFKKESVDPALRFAAYENMLRSALVYPDQAELTKILESRPAFAELWGDEVGALAGAAEAVRKNAL